MKNHPKFKSIFCAICCMLLCAFYGSCKKDDPSPEEQALTELTATWQLGTVTHESQNVTSDYTGFTLTVSGNKTYSTTNGRNPWPAQGTFDFTDETFRTILRDDNVNVRIRNLTPTNLVLELVVSTVRGEVSGSEGITGSFSFDLTKTN